MNGKINKDGNLEIKRGKEYKKQFCFYEDMQFYHYGLRQTVEKTKSCGDWCPQFGEPFSTKKQDSEFKTGLLLCQGRYLYFRKFDDKRGQND